MRGSLNTRAVGCALAIRPKIAQEAIVRQETALLACATDRRNEKSSADET
jgi:hypothetical protein